MSYILELWVGVQEDGAYVVEIQDKLTAKMFVKTFKKDQFQQVLKYLSDKEDELNPCESE